MTYAELELQMYSHSDIETRALKHLPKLRRYTAFTTAERTLTAEEEQFCEELRQTDCFLPLNVDARGFVSTEEQFEEQEGVFHTCQHRRYCIEPVHRHNYFEFIVVYAGKCEQIIDGVHVTMQTGDVCILSMGTAHQILPLEAGDIVLYLRVKPNAFAEHDAVNQLVSNWFGTWSNGRMSAPWQVIPCAGRERFWSVLQLLICEYYDHDLFSYGIVANSFMPLFVELVRARAAHLQLPLEVQHKDEGENILDYIRNFHTSCTLESISKQFGYSQSHISLLVKRLSGMNFTQLRQKYRMENAAGQLRNTNRTIAEIAEFCGYRNLSFFYRAFKEIYGATPQQYRESHCSDDNIYFTNK